MKKGANESTKALNRGLADLVILAADTEPLEIILHLPLLCEDKVSKNALKLILTRSFQNVPYVYVAKQADLGRACGVSRNIVACTILRNPDGALASKINTMKDRVD